MTLLAGRGAPLARLGDAAGAVGAVPAALVHRPVFGPLFADTIDVSPAALALLRSMAAARVLVSRALLQMRAVFDLGGGRRLRVEDGFFQVV